jgi:hypothetical protein
MPGLNFARSPVNCELLALTVSTHATPMFTLTHSASRPKISALDREDPLGRQTHQEYPPRWISLLDYALTRRRRAPASPLESALTRLLALKSFRFCTYVKHPGGPPACLLAAAETHALLLGLSFNLQRLKHRHLFLRMPTGPRWAPPTGFLAFRKRFKYASGNPSVGLQNHTGY